jgi:hypothetical protein
VGIGEDRPGGDDPDALMVADDPGSHRHLKQGRREHRDRHSSGHRRLVHGKEPAAREDRSNAVVFELPRRLDERLQQAHVGLCLSQAFGDGAPDHSVGDGERPGRGVADIAGDAREPRVHHHHPERQSVDRTAAPSHVLLAHVHRLSWSRPAGQGADGRFAVREGSRSG